MNRERLIWSTALVIVVVLSGSVPAVARAIADYARNSDRVDGIHAVDARTPPSDRAGKLIATNGRGRLPDHIVRRVRRADNADTVDNYDSARLIKSCQPGAVTGFATVPAGLSSGWTEVTGFGTIRGIGGPPPPPGYPGDSCSSTSPQARRPATGTYEVDPFREPFLCEVISTPPDAATVSVRDTRPLFATYERRCTEEGILFTVRVFDDAGTPVDAAFTLTLLDAPTILYP